LPSTRTEDRLMGEASDALKHDIRDAAERKVGHAAEVVSQTHREVSEDLRERGLSGGAVADAAAATADKVHRAGRQIAEGADDGADQPSRRGPGSPEPASSQAAARMPDAAGPRPAQGDRPQG